MQTGRVPNIPTKVSKVRSVENLLLLMGWALRSSQLQRPRFTANQKVYLTKKFDLGETSRRKSNPESVARAMMSGRDSQGNPLFTSAEFLTLQQGAKFFSRLPPKGRLPDVTSGSDEEADDAETESTLQELSNAVMREVSLEHPIICDCNNICDLISPSKLSSFSVQMLKEFCKFFFK